LNIQADSLASQAHTFQSSPVNPLRSTPLHLITPDGPIQGKWVSKIRFLWASQQFQKYLQAKYSWNDSTVTDVDWKALSTAISKACLDPIQIVKIANSQIPTNLRLHRAGLSPTPLCPLCQTQVETHEHLLQCSSPPAAQWRIQFTTALNSFLQKGELHSDFSDTVRAGVLGTIGKVTLGHSSTITFECRQAWMQQTSIGWNQIWHGKLSSHWNKIVLSHSSANSHKPHKNWAVTLILLLWKHWMVLWTTRNQAVHGADFSEAQSIIRQQLLADIQCFVDQRQLITPDLQATLPQQISEFEKKSTRDLHNWMSLYGSLLTENLASFATRCRQGMRAITAYFMPHTSSSTRQYYQDVNAPPWQNEGATPPPSSLFNQADTVHVSESSSNSQSSLPSPVLIQPSPHLLAGSTGEACQSPLS